MDVRDRYFAENHRLISDLYLAPDATEYQQSGRSSGSARWEETRRFFAELVHRSGSYLDVGCANGLLLESLLRWLAGSDKEIEPYGVDFVAGLVDMARRRVPTGRFSVANAWDWEPERRFDHVRTNVEYVPATDQVEFVGRQLEWVAGGGRIVVAHYPGALEATADVVAIVRAAGVEPAGETTVDRIRACWWDAP